MMAKKRIKPRKGKQPTKILDRDVSKALREEKGGTDDEYPTFSFKDCDENRYCLWDWQKDELKKLINFFQKMERSKWNEVPRISGLRYKTMSRKELPAPLPERISPDVTVIQLRVSDEARIFGYRFGNVFYIIWFDRKHGVFK